MADVAGRVRSLEKKLNFIMDNMRMKAIIRSGLVGADGVPMEPRVFEGTLNELFAMSKSLDQIAEDLGSAIDKDQADVTN